MSIKITHRVAAIGLVMAATFLTPSPQKGAGAAALDLRSEISALGAYVDELAAFDNACASLEKKAALVQAEVDSLQSKGDDLRRRVSSVETAIRSAIAKLKAAGEWDKLDATILERGGSDVRFQQFVRARGFRRIVEGAATGLSADSGEITSRLDVLRKRIGARIQEPIFRHGGSGLAGYAAPAAFATTTAPNQVTFRCRLAAIRWGLSYAFSLDPTTPKRNRAQAGYQCFCEFDAAACAALPTL